MAKKDPTTDKRCGTYAGYAAHGRRGERACQPCRAANTKKQRERRSAAGASTRKAPERKPAPPATPTVTAVERPSPAPAPASEDLPRVNAPAEANTDTAADVPEAPEYLKAKGRRVWADLNRRYQFSDGALLLLGEACRTVDRLERMAAALSSRSTLWFEVGDIELADEAGVPVVVNGMIGEARQLQNSLRQTLNQLGVVGVEPVNEGEKKSALDQLAERREARLAAQAGGGGQ